MELHMEPRRRQAPRIATGARRTRGEIEVLPSDSRRVRVYAGKEPVTGRRHYLTEVVPAGPKAAALAEKARTCLLNEVEERRNPRTGATVDQLLDRNLGVLSVEDITRSGYQRILRLHGRPIIGPLALARVNGEVIDSLYAELRRCRLRCDRQPRIDHRTDVEHDCDDRCRPHQCKPMGAAPLRHVHTALNGAFNRAVRWRWLGTNPIQQADAPPVPPADPDPPSPAEAARVLTEAWKVPGWACSSGLP